MKSKILPFFLYILCFFSANAQHKSNLPAEAWVDSVFRSLTPDEKLGQLMVVRLSSINAATREVTFYEQKVDSAVRQYNIGGICLFQGGPVKQTNLINYYQSVAKTPILISIDGETGVGMRIDSVAALPRQMMLGAVQNPEIIYQYGRWVGEQCLRMGIQVNYAPVVDINNNPKNPVINDRSFGEDKYRVAQLGIMYMKGLQDMGIMAVAKHFPGHGDVDVDSHYDLPVISKSRVQLDSLELYPFRELFKAGVGGAMVAHLYIPAIDNTMNRATSISYNNVTGLLRNEMGFQGLTFTDALEMKGVAQHYPDGGAAVESLIAGNDMLCLPGEIPMVIQKIKDAIRNKRIGWEVIDAHVRKILLAKYRYGLSNIQPAPIAMLPADLNRKSAELRKRIAEEAITLASYKEPSGFPLPVSQNNRVALLSIGANSDNAFTKRMRLDYNADVFYFDYQQPEIRLLSLIELLKQRYDAVVIGVHGLTRFPGKNFGMSDAAISLIRQADAEKPAAVFLFGNPYAAIPFCTVKNLIVCYEDEPIIHDAAANILNGQIQPKGKLPVTICESMPAGTGVQMPAMPYTEPGRVGVSASALMALDSLARDAIRQQATPGCVVLVARNGRIVYHKAFGYQTYDSSRPVTLETLYDMASVTKVCATTISIMKLYDQGKLNLNKKLGDYLPWVRGSDKESLLIKDILLHQARLKAWIPFSRETIDTVTGIPKAGFYQQYASPEFSVQVADSFFMRTSWRDTMYRRILQSPLEAPGKYIYSDNDFIFLGKIVEAISGMPLEDYVYKEFYRPLGLVTAGFRPLNRFPKSQVAPTEAEKVFRRQLIHGYVHDPGAAMFGGVAGHAGLFSNAYDIAVLMQLFLNKGVMNGHRYISDTTIEKFTAYNSGISRRGLGFDKPEKDNATRKEPYPTLSASPLTFGHTGFTGTCAWADPKENLIFILLTNRVNPDGNNKLSKLNLRSNMHEQVYKAVASHQ
jgi:beta-glucosidase-like glycosyl hydrolase/CubicO group peptidase (beta-lactamase class C family)